MVQNDGVYHHYATFFNLGFSLSWKVLSVGIEKRWCDMTNYKGLQANDSYDRDNIIDDDITLDDVLKNVNTRLKTHTLRVYLSFRF